MRLLLLSIVLLAITNFSNGQSSKKAKPKPKPIKAASELVDNTPKNYLTTNRYINEKDLSKGHVTQIVQFTYNDKNVTRTINGITETFKILNTKINEWGSTVYYAIDVDRNPCVWKFGKTNYGNSVAQFENHNGLITYDNSD